MAAEEITPSITHFNNRKGILVTWEGFDTALDYGWVDTWDAYIDFIPSRAACIVSRTGGSQDVIDVNVGGQFDDTLTIVATDIDNITAKDTIKLHPATGVSSDDGFVAWRYWKVDIIDEGEGNTLTVKLWLWE